MKTKPNEQIIVKKSWLSDLVDVCNSKFFDGIAVAAIILALLLGFGGCTYLVKKGNSLEIGAELKNK